MNGLHRLRLVAALASMLVTVSYIAAGLVFQRSDLPTLLALIGWNLTCLGLYRWPGK